MAITININTPDATININSSEDSGVVIPKQKPSAEKKSKDMGPHFLVTEEVVKNINCDHRGEDGHFDVDCVGFPSLYRCNICGELIDFKTKYDPVLVKKVIVYLWKAFQVMKTNNTEESVKKVLDDLGMSLYIIKEYMANTLEIIDDNLANVIISRYPKTPPFTPNMNDPFFNSSEFSQFFDSKTKEPFPVPDPDKKDAPPKEDKKPPAKPKQQTPPSSK